MSKTILFVVVYFLIFIKGTPLFWGKLCNKLGLSRPSYQNIYVLNGTIVVATPSSIVFAPVAAPIGGVLSPSFFRSGNLEDKSTDAEVVFSSNSKSFELSTKDGTAQIPLQQPENCASITPPCPAKEFIETQDPTNTKGFLKNGCPCTDFTKVGQIMRNIANGKNG